jgi:hypothetical protein
MSFRWFIYFCSVSGGCAAYVGWMLGRLPGVQHHVWQASIKGMFLGMALAVGLTLVDIFWHLSGREGAEVSWRVLVGGLVGGLGGFVGGLVGQLLYSATQLSVLLVVGWACTGLLIGASPGMFELLARLARDEESGAARRKVLNGVLGGTLGGLVGGLFFLLLRGLWGLALGARAEEFWSPSATGFVVLGVCIGLFIGLAQVILKEAWITVVRGFRAGREWMLTRPELIVGRAEGCDIPLFGDSKAQKQHARIVRSGDRYYIEDLDSPEGTYVNGSRIARKTPLAAGDLIEIGKSALRFGERHRRVEA